MSNEIFNYALDAPFDEELKYRTVISDSEGGHEYRYQKWLYPRHVFSVAIEARNQSEISSLWEFYQRHAGNYDTFLFENPSESSASGTSPGPVTDDVFATGDGAETTYYVGNKFSLPTGDCYLHDTFVLEKSVGGTGDYVELTEGAGDDYVLTASAGQVVMTAALPDDDVLRATYRFYYNVRFRNAALSRRAFAYQLWNTGLELIQVI